MTQGLAPCGLRQCPCSACLCIALAGTVGLFYALCVLVWVLAPGPFLGFMNNLFHGMDFSSMVQPRPFAWSGFLLALLVLSTWALLAGVFFGWLLKRLTP